MQGVGQNVANLSHFARWDVSTLTIPSTASFRLCSFPCKSSWKIIACKAHLRQRHLLSCHVSEHASGNYTCNYFSTFPLSENVEANALLPAVRHTILGRDIIGMLDPNAGDSAVASSRLLMSTNWNLAWMNMNVAALKQPTAHTKRGRLTQGEYSRIA